MYSGSADYDKIRQVKESVSIPVIANGDVNSIETYNSIKSVTNCDFVMIGRASVGNPFIFSKLLNKDVKMSKYDAIIKHINILKKYYSEKFIVLNMRKHIASYMKGENISTNDKLSIMKIENLSQLIDSVREIFKKEG